MQIANTKVSHRKTPPGASVEFIGAGGEAIEIELRGEEFVDMSDEDVIARAKATMGDASRTDLEDLSEDAGVDQTLTQP